MAMTSKDSSSKSARRSERRSPLDIVVAVLLVAACIAVALGLSSCNNPLEEDDPTLDMRVVNLVEDSPLLRFLIDDAEMSSATYEAVTDIHAARPGSHEVKLEAFRPPELVDDDDDEDDDPIPLGTILTQSFEGEMTYTIFAYGTMDDPGAFVMGTADQQDAVETDDHMVWQIVNAASGAQAVDVYVTAPEAKITSPTRVATLNFTEHSESMDLLLFPRADRLDEDEALFVDMIIEVRAIGTNDVLFTSSTIRIGEQSRTLFAIVPNGGSGPAAVKLMRVDSAGTQHVDPRDNAEVRFVNVSRDSPPLDVIRAAVQRQTLAQNVAFRDRSEYVQVTSGETDLIATPTADPATFLFLEEFSTFAHRSFSVYAVGPAADVDGLVVTDVRHSVPTQTRFRFLHAAPGIDDEDAVDIYVTPPGQVLDFDAGDDEVEEDDAVQFRKFTGVAFPSATDYLTLEAGTYEVHFVAAGTSRVLLDSAPFQVANGDVTTYVLHDSETGALELLPVDDAKR
jgi:hypothetical protein